MPESHVPTGVATGVGSLPGTDAAEAVRTVWGELPDFPHLPELPARGPGADLIGRGAALLVDLPVQLYAGRWQIASRPGMDLRRARDLLARDLDALTDLVADHDGPVKVAATGPWTLATSLHRQIGGPMLRDPGAVADLTASLSEGLSLHLAELAARLPRARWVLQLDEPSLPAVLAGTVPTESGLSRYPAVPTDVARDRLAEVIGRETPVVVHCCAPGVPVGLLRDAGAAGVGLDLDLVDMDTAAGLDPLGEALDAGVTLFAGVVPPVADRDGGGKEAAALVDRLWQRLGLPADRRRDLVTVTPACGMAGASPEHARRAMAACVEAARRLSE
ncbi:cobalamin-independent methionine synthase catalytic subunit [Stackebrandtia albiflava]|uniref:Cobalamin-independent methionine synthase catalytic subunit n=1 Tax=Stackebrandtia albiflava TaxID=406432 RepID=A0A562UQV5_9ACTN|nr:methionine synthase [Stackebrandtia albiflava]TWJ08002.1 cobalamin-independent methionine synthase catalytic subunit [Stackebrandtia albiflava]